MTQPGPATHWKKGEGAALAWRAARDTRFEQHVELTQGPGDTTYTLDHAIKSGSPALVAWIETYAMLHDKGAIQSPYTAAATTAKRLLETLDRLEGDRLKSWVSGFAAALRADHRAIASFRSFPEQPPAQQGRGVSLLP